MAHNAGAIGSDQQQDASNRGRTVLAFVAVAGICLVLVVASFLRDGAHSAAPVASAGELPTPGTSAVAAASVDPGEFLYAQVRPAPAIALTDQDANAFSLASLRGGLALVFFGYTHCPDVCPETIGTLGVAMGAYRPGRAGGVRDR